MFKKILGFIVKPAQPITPERVAPAMPSPISPVVVAPTPSPVVSTRTMTSGPTIAIVNASTVLTDAQVYHAMTKLQVQIDRDFSPIWKLGANLMAVPKGHTPPANAWLINIMDTSDEAGALGYHDLTAQGNPIAKVFAKDDIKYGLSWTVTVSHELLEMLVDPYIENCMFDQVTNTTGTLYAFEVCDACEDDSFGYMIDDVKVSDFVTPAWFESFRKPNSATFTFRNSIHAPLTLASGGYIGIFAVGPNTTGWTQKTAQSGPGQRLLSKGPYSRTKRREMKASEPV